MSNFKIDHIVIGSRTLEEGTEYIQDLLNVKLSPVGKHKIMGTHNRVLKLGNLYLEVISLDRSIKNKIKDCWFGLKENYVQEVVLKKPNLISFVISSFSQENHLDYYKKKIFVKREDFSWNFRRPKKSNLDRNLFLYPDVFPSLIVWKSKSPLQDMKENSLLFLELEIELNKKQIFYKNFVESFDLKEKINFVFKDENKLGLFPKLKANVINTKSKKLFSIN